jgi:hypothetical protein
MGIEWFSGTLPGIFLLPVLPFFLFWERKLAIWHVFLLPPGILFPFSQKQDVFSR